MPKGHWSVRLWSSILVPMMGGTGLLLPSVAPEKIHVNLLPISVSTRTVWDLPELGRICSLLSEQMELVCIRGVGFSPSEVKMNPGSTRTLPEESRRVLMALEPWEPPPSVRGHRGGWVVYCGQTA